MRIRFEPRSDMREIELRDIAGGSPLSRWYRGDEREIAPGSTVVWMDGASPATALDAATAVFRHGPDFVDATTGKNPLFICADCSADALEEHAFDYMHDEAIPFVDEQGRRLCVTCWLGRHPEQIVSFRQRGYSDDVVVGAQALAAKRLATRPAKSLEENHDE
jgi:hypothetical protein